MYLFQRAKAITLSLVFASLLIFSAALSLLAGTGTASASTATRQQASAGQPHYHLLSISATGQLQDHVVSQAQFIQARDQARKLALQQPSHNQTVIPLINRVPDEDCRLRDDFWKLHNNTTSAGGVCFANNGTININVYGVYEVDTGNNSGSFVYDGINAPGDGLEYCANDLISFLLNPIHDVTQVSIVGRTTSPCD